MLWQPSEQAEVKDLLLQAATALARAAMANAQNDEYDSPYAAEAVAHGKDIPLWAKIKEGKLKKGFKFSLAKLRVRPHLLSPGTFLEADTCTAHLHELVPVVECHTKPWAYCAAAKRPLPGRAGSWMTSRWWLLWWSNWRMILLSAP